jgi:hypothetical protein
MEWGKGRGRGKGEGGEVGSYYGGRGEDVRMGWERGCGGSGLSGVLVRKEGDVGGGLSIKGRGRLLGWRKLSLIQNYREVSL